MAQGGILSQMRVAYAIGSPHTWKKLEQLSEAAVPKKVAEKLSTTVFGTNVKSNMPGLDEVSDTEITMLTDMSSITSPNQNSLIAIKATKALVWWRIESADGNDLATCLWEAVEFQARVGDFDFVNGLGAVSMRKCTLIFGGTSYDYYLPAASLIG